MTRWVSALVFMACATLSAQPAEVVAYQAADAKIKAYAANHKREYFVGRIHDTIASPDGSVSYLICPMQGGCDRNSSWILMAHPDRGYGFQKSDSGVMVGVGTGPDGKYYGYGWFIKRIPDAAVIGGIAVHASLYDAATPPEIAKAYEERDRLKKAVMLAGYDPQDGQQVVRAENFFVGHLQSVDTLPESFGHNAIQVQFAPDPGQAITTSRWLFMLRDSQALVGDMAAWKALTLDANPTAPKIRVGIHVIKLKADDSTHQALYSIEVLAPTAAEIKESTDAATLRAQAWEQARANAKRYTVDGLLLYCDNGRTWTGVVTIVEGAKNKAESAMGIIWAEEKRVGLTGDPFDLVRQLRPELNKFHFVYRPPTKSAEEVLREKSPCETLTWPTNFAGMSRSDTERALATNGQVRATVFRVGDTAYVEDIEKRP